MSSLDEIKIAIQKLSLEEPAKLARWFHGWEDDALDRQMAEDIAAGRMNDGIGSHEQYK